MWNIARGEGSREQGWKVGLGPCPVGLHRAGRGLWILPECNEGISLKVFKQESDIIKANCKRIVQAEV